MSLTYPLTIPIYPDSYTITPISIVGARQAEFTGQEYTYDWGGQYWEVDLNFPNQNRETQSKLIAFLAALKGRGGTMYWSPTGGEEIPQGVATGAPVVDGADQEGNAYLLTTGWTASVEGILKAGDYFSIADNLYQCLQDVDSDGSGDATIYLFPNVRAGTADLASLTLSSPRGVFRLKTNGISYTLGNGGIYSAISFGIREVQNYQSS